MRCDVISSLFGGICMLTESLSSPMLGLLVCSPFFFPPGND